MWLRANKIVSVRRIYESTQWQWAYLSNGPSYSVFSLTVDGMDPVHWPKRRNNGIRENKKHQLNFVLLHWQMLCAKRKKGKQVESVEMRPKIWWTDWTKWGGGSARRKKRFRCGYTQKQNKRERERRMRRRKRIETCNTFRGRYKWIEFPCFPWIAWFCRTKTFTYWALGICLNAFSPKLYMEIMKFFPRTFISNRLIFLLGHHCFERWHRYSHMHTEDVEKIRHTHTKTTNKKSDPKTKGKHVMMKGLAKHRKLLWFSLENKQMKCRCASAMKCARANA